MIAYEFYCREKERGDSFIGLLPERRRSPERIDQGSIIELLRTFLGYTVDIDFNNIYFKQIEFEDRSQEGPAK